LFELLICLKIIIVFCEIIEQIFVKCNDLKIGMIINDYCLRNLDD